jgi:hypothetical protein
LIDPFAVKDCALISIATGERAQNLRELRDRLVSTHSGCIYHHFWGGLLRAGFDEPEYPNDFAAWANHGLRDNLLAERLALIDPTDFGDLEELRRELTDIIEERLDEDDWVPWAKANQQFHFTRSQIVVLDTRIRIEEPQQLKNQIPLLSVSSLFYHFIDARRRTADRDDDFSEWLKGFGNQYTQLVEQLGAVDPYFRTLTELRVQFGEIFEEYFGK